jgi:hypothetical protein
MAAAIADNGRQNTGEGFQGLLTPNAKPPPKMSDKEWKDNLETAAKEGKVEEIDNLWKKKPNRTGTIRNMKSMEADETIDSALLNAIDVAIQYGKVTALKSLIKLKSTLLAQKDKESEETALHRAVETENRLVVQELLLHSQIVKTIDARDRNGRTALHKAAIRGRQGIMEDLLANRAEIDAPDNAHITPLHAAVLWGPASKDATVTFLIENGAEGNTRDQYGKPLITTHFTSRIKMKGPARGICPGIRVIVTDVLR